MRKCRVKKNFWIDDKENLLLKNLSSVSGKSQTQIIRKLIRGVEIKEKPPQEFYEALKELLDLRKQIKNIMQYAKYTKEIDEKEITITLRKIDEFRNEITEKFLK